MTYNISYTHPLEHHNDLTGTGYSDITKYIFQININETLDKIEACYTYNIKPGYPDARTVKYISFNKLVDLYEAIFDTYNPQFLNGKIEISDQNGRGLRKVVFSQENLEIIQTTGRADFNDPFIKGLTEYAKNFLIIKLNNTFRNDFE